MKKRLTLFGLSILLLFAALTTTSCTCGFDCSRDNSSNGPVSLTLSFQTVLPEAPSLVGVTIDSINFRRDNSDDVSVVTFTNSETDQVEADTFQAELLDWAGETSLTVLSGQALEPDFYTIEIQIVEGDENTNFVREAGGELRALNISDNVIRLSGVEILGGTQRYVVVFHLAQALRFDANDNTYSLNTDFVRLQNESTSANLSGTLDSQLFNTDAPCDEKSSPTTGNRIYLYSQNNLDTTNLADAFTGSITDNSQAIAPFAVASSTSIDNSSNRQYVLNYLPAGNYTVAFTCNAVEDDPDAFDGIQIPLPEPTLEINLVAGDAQTCNFGETTECTN